MTQVVFYCRGVRFDDCSQASPLAMAGHLSGKRHTRAVARRFYVKSRREGKEPEPPLKAMDSTQGCEPDDSEGVESKSTSERPQPHKRGGKDVEWASENAAREQRRQLFDEHSSEPLRRNSWAEAPDVALVVLHSAIHKS